MKKSDRLLDIAKSNDIEIIEKHMENSKIEGLYSDNTVLINTFTKEEKYNEILGHELGHHFTLEENNLLEHQYKDLQEFFADAWSYREIIPLQKLAYYKFFDYDVSDILEIENISFEFFCKIFKYYESKYSYSDVEVEDYIINFLPFFNVKKKY